MNKKDWTYVIIAMVVVAVVVSLVMSKIEGYAILSPAPRTGVTTYTKADIDTMLSQVYTKAEVDATILSRLNLCEIKRIELHPAENSTKTCDALCSAFKKKCIFGELTIISMFPELGFSVPPIKWSTLINCSEAANFNRLDKETGAPAMEGQDVIRSYANCNCC